MRKLFFIFVIAISFLIFAGDSMPPCLVIGQPEIAGQNLIDVPIVFSGENISAIVFSLETKNLTVIDYDAPSAGIYFNPEQDKIDIAIFEVAYPFEPIQPGDLLTITFQVEGQPIDVFFSSNPAPSFGDVNGASVAGCWMDLPDADGQRFGLPRVHFVFLPVVR